MKNSTSTHVTLGGTWFNRVVTKQEGSHSTALADKQINEVRLGYKFYFYKRSNHEESFRAVKINHKNLVK